MKSTVDADMDELSPRDEPTAVDETHESSSREWSSPSLRRRWLYGILICQLPITAISSLGLDQSPGGENSIGWLVALPMSLMTTLAIVVLGWSVVRRAAALLTLREFPRVDWLAGLAVIAEVIIANRLVWAGLDQVLFQWLDEAPYPVDSAGPSYTLFFWLGAMSTGLLFFVLALELDRIHSFYAYGYAASQAVTVATGLILVLPFETIRIYPFVNRKVLEGLDSFPFMILRAGTFLSFCLALLMLLECGMKRRDRTWYRYASLAVILAAVQYGAMVLLHAY